MIELKFFFLKSWDRRRGTNGNNPVDRGSHSVALQMGVINRRRLACLEAAAVLIVPTDYANATLPHICCILKMNKTKGH